MKKKIYTDKDGSEIKNGHELHIIFPNGTIQGCGKYSKRYEVTLSVKETNCDIWLVGDSDCLWMPLGQMKEYNAIVSIVE